MSHASEDGVVLDRSFQDQHPELNLRPELRAPQSAKRQSNKRTGLPMTYVASWAVMAIASTLYLGYAVTISPPSSQQDPQAIGLDRIAAAPTRTNPAPAPTETASISKSETTPSKLSDRLAEKRKSLADVVDELSRPPAIDAPTVTASKAPTQSTTPTVLQTAPAPQAPASQLVSQVEPAATPETGSTPTPTALPGGIAILNAPQAAQFPNIAPNAPRTALPGKPPPPTQTAAAPKPVNTAAIVTGSIKPPPLPTRGPPRPKVVQAVAQPTPPAPRQMVARQTNFSAPTITRATPQQPVAVPRETPPAMGVRLASAPSVDALRLQWTLLRERHGQYLGGLAPRYILSGMNGVGPTYELIAGPLPGAMQALELCQDVSRSGTPCIIGDYVGNAL